MFFGDFHIHSRYSRATSKECVPELLELWARRKGIDVIGTGDFTHRGWREELDEKLVPSEDGLYVLKDEFRKADKLAGKDTKTRFIVSGEISSIYKKNGKVRKVHNLILLPGLKEADVISKRLEVLGNLHSDGRPILGLDSRNLLEIVMEACPQAIFIPAHIWTPHFSLFGAYSGFDDITECFEDLTGHIYALETGLSSDPPMNWRLSALDRYTMVSNSDAHSPANLGREVNIFDTGLSYPDILNALKNRDTKEFYGTVEFFPEEGKYHYDGHRNCKVCMKPSDTRAAGGRCPVCGGRITVGVLHRVETLADREEGFVPPAAKHFESLIPLYEVIASSTGSTAASSKTKEKYDRLIQNLGPELFVLRDATLPDIERVAGTNIAEGIRRLRAGIVDISPGYDGEYGKIRIIDKKDLHLLAGQLCFIQDDGDEAAKRMDDGPRPAASVTAAPLESEAPEGDGAGDGLTSEESAEAPCPAYPYELNEAQWQAVSSESRAIAVIAGPGTGKTKTLVSRAAYLIEKCGVHPGQITAVTFTRKAADEMRARLEKHFRNKQLVRSMTIGTFHSICLGGLAGKGEKKGISIIDEYGALSILAAIIREEALDIAPRNAFREISRRRSGLAAKDGSGADTAEANTAEADTAQSNTAAADIIEGLYALYCKKLESYGLTDYDGILLDALQRWENGEAAAGPGGDPAESFTHLLVDEFQDINDIQYRLIKKWSEKSEGIFIIGDPDQSIYGFRGSDFRYFDKFTDDFPDAACYRLEKNYRSTPEIIAAAAGVITGSGDEKRFLKANRQCGDKLRLVEARDEYAEASFIAREINRLVGGTDMLDAHQTPSAKEKRSRTRRPWGFSDIAVLYRTNRQAEVLEQCLLREGIQYLVAGRGEFLSEPPVRETLSFFKLLMNPEDIAAMMECIRAAGMEGDWPAALLEDYAAGERSVASFARLAEGDGRLKDLADRLLRYEQAMKKDRPDRIIESWMADSGLTESKSMALLLNTAVMYEDMNTFMSSLLLGRESDVVRSSAKRYPGDAVSLMTLHAAKGLEFPVVFICGANDGVIPLRSTRSVIDTAEERRLFYVGMTRARDELVLTTYRERKSQGNIEPCAPTPFIRDIPGELLIKEAAFAEKPEAEYQQLSFF